MIQKSALSLCLALSLLCGCAAHRGGTAPQPLDATSPPSEPVDLGSMVILLEKDPLTGLDAYDGDDLFALGFEAMKQEKYALARDIFAKMIETFPEHPDIVPASWNYGLALEFTGDMVSAIGAFAFYLESVDGKEPAEAARCRLRMATLLQLVGQPEEMRPLLAGAEGFDGFEIWEVWELRALLAMAKGAEDSFLVAESELNRVRKDIQRSSQATGERYPYQMAMLWYLAGALDRQHAAAVIIEPEEEEDILTGLLVEKVDLLISARKRFILAVKLREPTWSGAAAYSMGGLYEDFRRDLIAAPIPSSLSAEAAEVYEAMVFDWTTQFLEAAAKDYRGILDKADQLDLDSLWVEELKKALERCEEELAAVSTEVER